LIEFAIASPVRGRGFLSAVACFFFMSGNQPYSPDPIAQVKPSFENIFASSKFKKNKQLGIHIVWWQARSLNDKETSKT
jgi:hypothetical protein